MPISLAVDLSKRKAKLSIWPSRSIHSVKSRSGPEVRSTPVRLPFRVPVADSKPFDLVGFGENSVDLLTVVAEHPTPNSKQRVQRFGRLPGGQIATALAACARLGLRTRY